MVLLRRYSILVYPQNNIQQRPTGSSGVGVGVWVSSLNWGRSTDRPLSESKLILLIYDSFPFALHLISSKLRLQVCISSCRSAPTHASYFEVDNFSCWSSSFAWFNKHPCISPLCTCVSGSFSAYVDVCRIPRFVDWGPPDAVNILYSSSSRLRWPKGYSHYSHYHHYYYYYSVDCQ